MVNAVGIVLPFAKAGLAFKEAIALKAAAKGAEVAGLEIGEAEALKTGETALLDCSFTATTPVLMADGSTKPIDSVQPGEAVATTDPDTGASTGRLVTATRVHDDAELTDVSVTAGATTVVHTTPEHPFWNRTRHTWTAAGELAVGDELQTADGTVATVAAVVTFAGPQAMHNLTVADVHTYYVLAGQTPVLVHNAGGVGLCPVSGKPHGPMGEAATLDRLQTEGYTDIAREVTFYAADGTKFRADFVARAPDGRIIAIEAKTGQCG